MKEAGDVLKLKSTLKHAKNIDKINVGDILTAINITKFHSWQMFKLKWIKLVMATEIFPKVDTN